MSASITILLSTVPGFEVAGSFSHVLNCLEDMRDTGSDVVLTDIEMPGIETVKELKASFPRAQIPQYKKLEQSPGYQLMSREKEVLTCIVKGLPKDDCR